MFRSRSFSVSKLITALAQTALIMLLTVCCLWSVQRDANAQTLTVLHTFSGNDGADPQGGLALGSDGNFYGTTYDGGVNRTGSVYKITSSGALTTLYSFAASSNGDSAYGKAYPVAGLVQGTDGDFYGATQVDGTNYTGTIFKITSSGVLTILHTFGASPADNADGAYPDASLIQSSDGTFYGVTDGGGVNGTGTVFKITSSGALTTLHSFDAIDSKDTNADGSYPRGALVQGSDGNFYGTTSGGGVHGDGTVFKVTPLGALTTLRTFNGDDGEEPWESLVPGQ